MQPEIFSFFAEKQRNERAREMKDGASAWEKLLLSKPFFSSALMCHLQLFILHLLPVWLSAPLQALLRVDMAPVISTNDSHYVVML